MIAPLAQLALFVGPARAETVLLYDDNATYSYAEQALIALGYSYTVAGASNFTTYLSSGSWDAVVIDMPSNYPSSGWESQLSSYISSGGKVVMGYWQFQTSSTLMTAFQCYSTYSISTPGTVYRWDTSHAIFTTPYSITTSLSYTSDAWADDGDYLAVYTGGTAVGGYASARSSTAGAIVVGHDGATVYNGLLFDSYGGDADGDGTKDIVELIANETYFVIHGSTDCDADDDGFDSLLGDCGGTDCDDTHSDTYLGAVERADGRDNDCDSTVDEGTTWYDDDGDGFSEAGGDCDDADSGEFPGAEEICDGADTDCDTVADEGTDCYDDDFDGYSEDEGDCNDGDGDVDPGEREILGNGIDDDCDGVVDDGAWDEDGDGYTVDGGDCDDGDDTVYPGAPEILDGQNNDCDEATDEGTSGYDDDFDGYSEDGGDCDDSDGGVSPGAEEVAGNGVDDDCNGTIDGGSPFSDDDGDGFSEEAGDCDDANPLAAPGVEEQAGNGRDDDCDGSIDEVTDDADGDGVTVAQGDCDDTDGWTAPGFQEFCDGVDNDCDGTVDNKCELLSGENTDGGGSCGCTSGPLPAGLWALLSLVGLLRRRRE